MIDYNDLINRIESMQDLPVSEEMLGAYSEGSLNPVDAAKVDGCIANDATVSALVEGVDNTQGSENLYTLGYTSTALDDIELPNVPTVADKSTSELDIAANPDTIISDSDDSFIDVGNSLNIESEINATEENINEQINTTMATNIQAARTIIGEPGQNIKDPIFIQQPDDHSCALRSQQIVLRDFGIDIPFKDLEKLALEKGVYSEEGTSMCDVGKVLEIAGVGMHQVTGCSMYDLANELAQGHRVIVGVDANELWYNNSLGGKLKNWLDDALGQQGGNHALIVAGIEVNPNDPNDVKVVLTDTGAENGDLRIEYPMKQFMDAWKDTNCFMAATDMPAPYQYDPTTQKEVPSNFVMEHHFNQFIEANSYQLAPDLINVPTGYQPEYTNHLEFVGDETYDDFSNKYNEILESRTLLSSVKSSEQTDKTENVETEKTKETQDGTQTSDNEIDDTNSDNTTTVVSPDEENSDDEDEQEGEDCEDEKDGCEEQDEDKEDDEDDDN